MKPGSILSNLTSNSRFWVLTLGITASFLIAGIVQLYVPTGSVQFIRIQEIYGFVSFGLLYIALLASPLLRVFPRLPEGFKKAYTHNRRPIGVLAFYFAFLHAFITFFDQLGGFGGIAYYSTSYQVSLLLAVTALIILTLLASTSIDRIIKKMGFPRWKKMQRIIYVAGLAILLHIVIIGTHFDKVTIFSIITSLLVGFLLILQVLRINAVLMTRQKA